MNENRVSNERGQSLILVAIVMVALVIFVAITVDVSSAYYARRTAQNAADGAALAGVSVMATGINKNNPKLDDDVKEYMNAFAEDNGIEDTEGDLGDEDNANVEGYYVDMSGNRLPGEPMAGMQDPSDDVPVGAFGIEAITYITAPTYFGGILGFDGYPLQARAVSLLRQACSAGCVRPITTDFSLMEDAEVGQCFNIWRESQTGNDTEEISPGLYGWVSWTWQEAVCGTPDRPCPEVDQKVNGCDAGVLADNLSPAYCASGFIKVGDWISSTSGKVNGDDVRCLLNYYIGYVDPAASCPITSTVPVPFTIPVYEGTTADLEGGSSTPCLRMSDPTVPTSGGLHYHVRAFARMQMLGYQLSQGTSDEVNVGHDGQGCVTIGEIPHNGSRITAQFVRWVDDTVSSDECYDPGGTVLVAPMLVE